MSPVVALLSTTLAAAAAPNPAEPPDACRPQGRTPAAASTETPGARRLGELPPSHHFMTVLRKEYGCEVAVVKENGRNRIVPLPEGRAQLLESRRLQR